MSKNNLIDVNIMFTMKIQKVFRVYKAVEVVAQKIQFDNRFYKLIEFM